MSHVLQVPARRAITPMIGMLIVIALAGALLLGFGLRAWTQSTPRHPAPVVVSVPQAATAPAYECKMGRPC